MRIRKLDISTKQNKNQNLTVISLNGRHRHKEQQEIPVPVSGPPVAEPIKIKIQKDKIQPVPESSGLKIKIPKDKIRSESIGEFKIKIPKEKIAYAANNDATGKGFFHFFLCYVWVFVFGFFSGFLLSEICHKGDISPS